MDKEDTGTTQVCAEKDAVQEILHSLYQQQLQQRQTRNAVGEQQLSRNAVDATSKHGDVSGPHQHVKEDTSDVEMITFSKGIKEASRPQETDHAGDVQRTRLPPWHGLTTLEISDSIFFPDGQKEISPAPDRGPQRVPQSYVHVPVPGAYSVSGPFAGQNNSEDQIPQEPIDAVVSRDDEEEDSDLIDSAEPRLSSERSRQYWRLRLLRVLSLEVNVVLMAVFVVLLTILAVSMRGHNNNDNNSLPTAIEIPSSPLAVTASPAQTPTLLLDLLNLPDHTLSAMERSESPQSKAYLWLVNNISNQTSTHKDLPTYLPNLYSKGSAKVETDPKICSGHNLLFFERRSLGAASCMVGLGDQ